MLTDPEKITDDELINVSYGLMNNIMLGVAFAAVTIILIILAVIVLRAIFT